MTPTSAGGEQQACISGGIQFPIGYSLRRIAEVHRRICHAMHDVRLAARMPEAFLKGKGKKLDKSGRKW